MTLLTDNPFLLFVLSLVSFALSSRLGTLYRQRSHILESEVVKGFDVVRSATLTLLALLIGFTFSMAVSRYDQRKDYEEAEANAIGTEYFRASLLPAADEVQIRKLIVSYINQRILFYTVNDRQRLREIDKETAKLQTALWAAVREPALANPTLVAALAVQGMNDVINSQGYTQAAWWNRIPHAAWILMWIMGICCTAMVGYGEIDRTGRSRYLWVLPIVVSIAFFLIAEIDSPRSGVVRVIPQNLQSLYESLHGS